MLAGVEPSGSVRSSPPSGTAKEAPPPVVTTPLCFSAATRRRIANICRLRDISLTPRGDVIFSGEIVGRYEIAAGTLVVSKLAGNSPLVALLELRPFE